MKISELTKPTPETIKEIKQSYNRVLKRYNEASKYLNSEGISQEEKEKRLITFRIEVVDALEAYLGVLSDWGINVADDEILGGLKLQEVIN